MSTNRYGQLLAYRYALWACRELRQRPGMGTTLREGLTRLDKQLAGLEPEKLSAEQTRNLYFAFVAKAARIRRHLLADMRYPWVEIGYTSRPDFPGHVYAAPVGEPEPWRRGELQPWER